MISIYFPRDEYERIIHSLSVHFSISFYTQSWSRSFNH